VSKQTATQLRTYSWYCYSHAPPGMWIMKTRSSENQKWNH